MNIGSIPYPSSFYKLLVQEKLPVWSTITNINKEAEEILFWKIISELQKYPKNPSVSYEIAKKIIYVLENITPYIRELEKLYPQAKKNHPGFFNIVMEGEEFYKAVLQISTEIIPDLDILAIPWIYDLYPYIEHQQTSEA